MPYVDPEKHREYNREWMQNRKVREALKKFQSPDGRRCVPVRLTQIDEQIRLRAARQAGAESEPDEKLSLLYAALFPSDRIYWIAP